MNESFTKILLSRLISNIFFYPLKILIYFHEALDERGLNTEIEILKHGFECVKLCLCILQSSSLKMMNLDLENSDLVNQLSWRYWSKEVLR